MNHDELLSQLYAQNIKPLDSDTLEDVRLVKSCPLQGPQNTGIINAMGIEQQQTNTPTPTHEPDKPSWA